MLIWEIIKVNIQQQNYLNKRFHFSKHVKINVVNYFKSFSEYYISKHILIISFNGHFRGILLLFELSCLNVVYIWGKSYLIIDQINKQLGILISTYTPHHLFPFIATQIITLFLTLRLSSNHDKGVGFQPIKILIPLFVPLVQNLFCTLNISLSDKIINSGN